MRNHEEKRTAAKRAGYNAYMYQIIEIGSGDGYGFAEWTYPQDDEED